MVREWVRICTACIIHGCVSTNHGAIYHLDWRVVPVELKEKLWDYVKGAFLVDENSKTTSYHPLGLALVSLQPPTEYNYIPIEDWRKLVANRLSKEFRVKSKRKRKEEKYVYIHRVSRKGYAGLQEELVNAKDSSRKPIDRWVLWKLARLKKGEYDEVTRPVVEKIDELTKAVEEGKITCVGQKDILTLALGTLEHPGRIIALKAGKKEPLTPRSEVSSTNIRKQLLQHEEIGGKTHDSAHVENLSAQGTRKASPLTKISIDGADILVVILYPLQPNALLPFPLSENIKTIREGVGYEVLWPIAFVINDDDEDVGKRKNKMKKIQASPKKIKYENPRDVQLFSKTVSRMLEGKPHPKLTFNQCFGMKFQTFLLTSEMNDVISAKELTMNCICFYIWRLHEHLDETLQEKIIFIHPEWSRFIVDRLIDSKLATWFFFHITQGNLLFRLQLQQPYQDIKDIVNMGFNFVSQKKKGSKKSSSGWLLSLTLSLLILQVHRNVIQHKGKCHSSSPLKWCSPWKESSSHQLVLVCQCHNKLRLAPC
ncbi:hypothetical protein AAG906_015651 [Vitis piasezkii]